MVKAACSDGCIGGLARFAYVSTLYVRGVTPEGGVRGRGHKVFKRAGVGAATSESGCRHWRQRGQVKAEGEAGERETEVYPSRANDDRV